MFEYNNYKFYSKSVINKCNESYVVFMTGNIRTGCLATDRQFCSSQEKRIFSFNPLADLGYVFCTLSIFINSHKYLGKIFEKMSYSERVRFMYHKEIQISVNILFPDGYYCVERVHKMYPFGNIKIALKTVSHGSI